MLNNLTNFFNLITHKMIKKVPESTDLVALGTNDPRYYGNYKPTAITYADLKADILAGAGGGCCSVDTEGNYIAADSSDNTVTVGPGASHDIPNFSGMVIVNDHYDGGVETWICGGGDCTLISTTSAAPGNSTFTQSGSNGYEWTNVDNLNGPFTFTVIKTRLGA